MTISHVIRTRRFATAVAIALSSLAFVAFADIVSGTSTTGTSTHVTITDLTINKPSVSVGDLMLAGIAVDGGSAVAVTPPSGWTQIARTDNDVNVTLITYYKIVSGSEPSSYTWQVNTQTRAVGGITPYTGIDTSNPIDTAAGDTGFSATATTSAIATASNNEEVVALYATNVAKSFSTSTGMTQKYNLSHTPVGPSASADDVLQPAAGSTGSKSSTIDAVQSRFWSSQIIALRHPATQIAIDTHAGAQFSSASSPFTVPMTLSGSNRVLLVHVTIEDPTNPDLVTGATYAGSPMTLINKVGANQNGNDETYLFAIVAPPTGTNNVSVTTSASPSFIVVEGADYTGVNQAIPTNVATSTAMGQTSFSAGPLTTANNSWIAGAIANTGSNPTIQSPNVARDSTNGARVLVDSNGTTGGSDTVNATVQFSNSAWLGIIAELAPAQ